MPTGGWSLRLQYGSHGLTFIIHICVGLYVIYPPYDLAKSKTILTYRKTQTASNVVAGQCLAMLSKSAKMRRLSDTDQVASIQDSFYLRFTENISAFLVRIICGFGQNKDAYFT